MKKHLLEETLSETQDKKLLNNNNNEQLNQYQSLVTNIFQEIDDFKAQE